MGGPECSHVILSTVLNICVVVGVSLPSGFLVEGPGVPVALAVFSSDCSEAPVPVYLGAVTGGCFDLPAGTNHLFSVETDPEPGQALYITFF